LAVSNNGLASRQGKPVASLFNSFFSFLITFVLMFLTWIVLSGKFDPLLLWLGGLSSFFVAYYFYDLLFSSLETVYIGMFFRFLRYMPWLMWEIVKANCYMMYLVFHPRMKDLIDPHIITFKTNLKSDIAITTLANSITLTPGTITVTADNDGIFRVHAIDRKSASGLPGTMLEKVAEIFGEKI